MDSPAPHQRAQGTLAIRVGLRDGQTVLRDLRQEGSLKARFPRTGNGPSGGWFEAVSLNSSGGVAGGDRLSTTLEVEAGAQASFSAQAAERFYRALPGDAPALVTTRLSVAAGACAEWLPQESILYDRCALRRRLDVELAGDAWFLGTEMLVFGRAAMGERLSQAMLSDTIAIRRDGRLLLHDAIRLSGDVATQLAGPATARGARAVATILHVSPDTEAEAKADAEARLEAFRAAVEGLPVEAGASAWDGLLMGRILADDGAALRAAVIAGLQSLRGLRCLPRVWMC